MDADENLDGLEGDDKIVQEAKDRFTRCQHWESTARQRYIEDIKFANADSDNGYQWPNDLQKARIDSDKPTLTINKTAQHNNQIINDAKQNKPSVKIRPVGNGATFESAEVFEGIIRHIEYISNAQVAYDEATTTQVEGGIGYWRIIADYADEDTFDQDLFIRHIKDPLSVYLDPDITEKDGSDANFAIIFDDILKEDFERMHPEFKGDVPRTTLDNNDVWLTEKHIRVAEYYRRNERKDELIAYKLPDGTMATARKSWLPKEVLQEILDHPETQRRPIIHNEVEWYKIAGDKIIDRRVGNKAWPGKYIPIVRLIGKETVIEGILDRKGHTRALKDPQRMYNYNSSAAIEYGALQTKAPWVGPAQAFEEYEDIWKDANLKNYSFLPYNHINDDGQEIPAPQRIEPPQGAQFYVQERNLSAQDMMMVSGQYQDSLGQQSNAVSGKAINQRERQGDKATYMFIDNLGIAIRYTGKILIDLIPHYYDSPGRIMKILAEDGTESQIQLDPQAKIAYQQKQAEEQEVVAGIFNPNVGKYDVQADIGPSYGTQRQEAFNAFSQIAAQNPQLMNVVGDLLFKSADFPGADELAERLKRMVPAQALGEGAPPEVAQLQLQMQKMSKILENTLNELAAEKLKLKGKQEQKDIDAYEAITKRMETMFKNMIITPKDNAKMLHDIMTQEHQSNLNLVEQASQADIQSQSEPSDDENT